MKICGSERSVCDDCRLLGEQLIENEGRIRELLAFRTWDGLLPKKHRRQVERLQRHRFSDVTKLAVEILDEDEYLRKLSKAKRLREVDEYSELELQYQEWLDLREDRLGAELSKRLD